MPQYRDTKGCVYWKEWVVYCWFYHPSLTKLTFANFPSKWMWCDSCWSITCITGVYKPSKVKVAFCAKCETNSKEEENKASATSPSHLRLQFNIDWRRWCQKDQSKHDLLFENCHLSGYHKHWQQHKPQEMKNTRAKINFNKVRLSAAKVRFAQSNRCLMSKHSGGKNVENLLLACITSVSQTRHFGHSPRCLLKCRIIYDSKHSENDTL